ncbi:MAG: hypothetical protein ACR2PQ_06020 [Myxococcota bacterium]
MAIPGSYKIASRNRSFDAIGDPALGGDRRVQRILDSLIEQILAEGGCESVRVRRVFTSPREIFRLELELPDLGYQRTTLLDRDALEELLEIDEVRSRMHGDLSGLVY